MSAGSSGSAIWTRPERSPTGRRPRRSRAEIAAAAVAIADREGLDAVSMRRVAAGLGTGAASLYRYLDSREDLLDLMTDATGAEYSFRAPAGDWLADLVALAAQARAIMHRHPWLADLVPRRPTLGPNGLALLQHFLEVLEQHPASTIGKLDAFGMLFAVTAVFVQAELSGGPESQRRNAAYLQQVISTGEYPRLGELLAGPPAAQGDADRYLELIRRILTGLLGHAT